MRFGVERVFGLGVIRVKFLIRGARLLFVVCIVVIYWR